jgi:hypothetical protein
VKVPGQLKTGFSARAKPINSPGRSLLFATCHPSPPVNFEAPTGSHTREFNGRDRVTPP